MVQVMDELGITAGTLETQTEPLLKFLHQGKIKYINQKNIRTNLS
jgi:hypothetical protein